MAASSALKAALGDSYALLEEAGVAEYVEETLQGVVDDGGGAEDIQEAVLPFLLDAGAVAGDEEGEALCAVLHAQLQLGSAPAPSPGDEFKKLDNAVSMGKLVKADEAQVVADNAEKLKVQINYNTTLGPSRPPVNSLIDEDESEEAMKRRFKAEKRAAKRLKRELRREKLQGMQREEFMRELTREPVVLHWKGGGGGPRDILLKDAQMEIAGKQLLKDTDLTIVYGRKYGLVGRNGVGKTTFLKFLAAARFEGVPPNLQILHIEQEVVGGEQTVLDMVLATDVERSALLAEEAELLGEAEEEEAEARAAVEAGGAGKDADDLADEAERQSRLLEIAQRLDEIDARSAPSRAGAILFGLGFDSEMQQQPTSSFSGGWRMRVSLARALFIEPDVLLLDEPTNHLDLHAVLWLEEYLQGWDKSLVVVSHARSFLNAVCTDVLHFYDGTITRYKGDYDTFEETRAERLRQQGKNRERVEAQRAHMQAFVDKFRASANRASQAQSRLKAMQRLEVVAEVMDDPGLRFAFPDPEPLPPPVMQLLDVGFGYPGRKELFRGVELGLDMESRVALVGPNGIGKSTLLKIVLGELEPVSGEVKRAGRLRMGRFTQHHVDQLDLSKSALDAFLEMSPSTPPLEIRKHLGQMGMGGPEALQKMGTLSGGQKSRVAFAQIMWQKPHVLLLDEPTNHLDLDAVEALIHALLDFRGGLLVISHDEHLVSSICEELWVAEPGKVSVFKPTHPDSISAFEEWRAKEKKKGPPAVGGKSAGKGKAK